MLPALAATFLFAISAACAGQSTRILGGVRANFHRLSLATLLLGLWAHSMGHGLSGPALPYLVISGLIGFGVGDTALYQAFPKLGARLSMILVHCTAAPFAALVEWLWLGTTLSPAQLAAAAMILCGVALALAPERNPGVARTALSRGIFFGIVAGCGQGLGAVLSRKGYAAAALAGDGISTLSDGITAAYQRILAGWSVALLMWGVLLAREKLGFRESTNSRDNGGLKKAWPWVISNALAGPALGVSCFQLALVTESTAVVLPIVAITPLAVIPLSRLTEGDRPGWRTLAGSVIAVAGAVMLARLRFAR